MVSILILVVLLVSFVLNGFVSVYTASFLLLLRCSLLVHGAH